MIRILALAAVLSMGSPAWADEDRWADGTQPPDGLPQASWELTKKWLTSVSQRKSSALAKLSPAGLAVELDATDAKLSRACRRLNGKTLRGKSALARLAACLRPQLRRDDLRAEPPSDGGSTQPPDVLWDEWNDNDCDFGDHFAFDVVELDGRWTIAGVRITLTDCVSP